MDGDLVKDKSLCLHIDLKGIGIEELYITNNETILDSLKEKGFNILLNPKSVEVAPIQIDFYILGKELNLE